jgi:transcriptional regulator with XRE-family HTH domain
MKKVATKGADIKALRSRLEKLSTQKERANEAGVSVRMLRKIENENARVSLSTASRLARALGVHREQIVCAGADDAPLSGGRTVVVELPDFEAVIATHLASGEERLIPRHDFEYAKATKDEASLYKDAHDSHDVDCIIELQLSDSTSAYAQELLQVLGQQTRSQRNILAKIEPDTEIAIRRRIRDLIVLLRGNDVWIYTTVVHRTLPERDTLAPEGEPREHQRRLVIALAPPGEYGEDSLRIPVDNGQPFLLRPLRELLGKLSK